MDKLTLYMAYFWCAMLIGIVLRKNHSPRNTRTGMSGIVMGYYCLEPVIGATLGSSRSKKTRTPIILATWSKSNRERSPAPRDDESNNKDGTMID